MNQGSENLPNQAWDTISEQLDHVLDLDSAGRESWLAGLRTRDPELATRLESLLAVRERDGFADFLSSRPPSFSGLQTASLVGRRIGPYEIEAEAGRGGMGSVWRARRVDGRYEGVVAIKLVHASWIDEGAEQRFQTEGQLVGSLEHPHIARLLDAGVLDGTQPYLVLEYVEGEPIDEYCQRRNLGIEARIRLFLDVLKAVAHAHSHLIVHRDLKPGNIFVTGDGVVKLLDFGIAKLLQGGGASGSLTQSGEAPLTPQFAAPEQLTGEAVTTGTDVYTLGLVLFVLLTGTGPFPTDRQPRAQYIQAILTQDPPRPSTVGMLETVPRRVLKGDLDNILGKALKKDPAERYVSVTDFADDLQRLLRHEPVRAHADTVPYRVAKFVRRHRGGVLGAVLTTIALVVTTAFAIGQMLEARAQRDLANFEAAASSAQGELTEFLLGDSLGLAPHDVAAARLARAHAMISQRFSSNPLIQARMLISLSGRYIDLGDTSGAAPLMQEAQDIAARLDDPHLNADIACGRAQDAIDAGDLNTAHAQESVGRANMERLKIVPSGLMAECAMTAATIAQAEGNYPQAIAVTVTAMNRLEKEGLQRTSRYTSIAHEHARSLVLAANYREGFAAEQKVMAIAAAAGRDSSSAYLAMLNVGSFALLRGGQPLRAIELIDATDSRIRKSAPDAELPFYISGTRLLAQCVAGLAPTGDQRLKELSAVADKQGLSILVLRYQIDAIRTALARGDIRAAEQYWSSISAMESKRGDALARRDAVLLLITHAALELAEKNATAAGAHLAQALALIPAASRETDPNWRMLLLTRVQVEYAQAQYPAAETDARATLERARQEAVDPNSSAWIGEALIWRSKIELAQGRRAEAAQGAKEAMPHLKQNLDAKHALLVEAQALAATS